MKPRCAKYGCRTIGPHVHLEDAVPKAVREAVTSRVVEPTVVVEICGEDTLKLNKQERR